MEKSLRIPAASFGDDNSKVIFGRESDKKEIIDLLISNDANDRKLSVISLLANDGMGKTILARLIYKDHRVSEHCDLAWAYVSDLSDTFMVTKAVLESFTLQSYDLKEQDMSQLEANLCERLEGKRFLLVLNIASRFIFGGWEALQPHFIKGANGSYVFVTTRNEISTSSIKPLYVYHIKPLSDEDSWSLFVNFASGGQNPSSYPELEDIGRQIMEKCCGSPLAIRTVGCLLRLKLQVEERDAVLDHLKQNLEDFKTALNNTLTLSYSTLKLSYDHLSEQIKRCFAYCSIFPSGYEFEKNKLVLLWMAEGLPHDPRGNSRMEDVGDEYFQELLSRSFLQISSGNKSSFVMHDLVSHFAVEVSGRYCCRLEDLGPFVSEIVTVKRQI